MKVLLVGAGIGGLALAQGLRRRGVNVAVFERDRTPTDRLQGYRIHINEFGSRALHYCLAPELFEAFLATCGQPNRGIGFFSHRLRELVWFGDDGAAPRDPDPVASVHSASRTSLRQVLLAGLSDAVYFDKKFSHYDCDGAGEVCLEGETGFLVNYGDTQEISDRVIQLLEDQPLRATMGRLGRERAIHDFSFERFKRSMVARLANLSVS